MKMPPAFLLVLSALIILPLVTACGGDDSDSANCRLLSSLPFSYDVTQNATIPAGCFIVEEDIYVSSNATLTVSPKTTLKFKLRTGIEVQSEGTVSAEGTPAETILFTGEQAERGFWNGVTFNNSANPKNALGHVTIEYAGAKEMQDSQAGTYRAAVMLDSSGFEVRAKIANCTIRESSGYGLYLDDLGSLPNFSGNTITKNATGAVIGYAASMHNFTSASQYTGNDQDLNYVYGSFGFSTSDQTWDALGVPFIMDGTLHLDKKLTLKAGTTIQFKHGAGIDIDGFNSALVAVGTADKPIIFTGLEKTAGFWAGLYFLNTNDTGSTTARSRLENCVVEYGGGEEHTDSYATPFRANITLDSSGYNVVVDLLNSKITNSTGHGVWLDCLATLTNSNNTFSANPSGDIGQEPNCT